MAELRIDSIRCFIIFIKLGTVATNEWVRTSSPGEQQTEYK